MRFACGLRPVNRLYVCFLPLQPLLALSAASVVRLKPLHCVWEVRLLSLVHTCYGSDACQGSSRSIPDHATESISSRGPGRRGEDPRETRKVGSGSGWLRRSAKLEALLCFRSASYVRSHARGQSQTRIGVQTPVDRPRTCVRIYGTRRNSCVPGTCGIRWSQFGRLSGYLGCHPSRCVWI